MHILKNLRLRRHSSPASNSSPDIATELRATARRLEALLDQLPHVVLYETGAGREYISQNIHKLLGYEAEAFTEDRDSFPRIIHPDDSERMGNELKAWNAAGRPGVFRAQFRARKKSGEYIWLEDQIVGADHSDGSQSMIGVMVDVTARNQVEQRYRAIVDAADVAGLGLAIFFERDGVPVMVYMNSALHRIYGWSLDELRERGVFSIIQPQALSEAERVWSDILHGELEKYSFETEVVRKNGEHATISIGLSTTRIDDETAIIAFITDITERKHAEEELIRAKLEAEELSRIKSNILANFSHELRTPMHSILGFSSILTEEVDNEDLRNYASSIQRSGERLLNTLTSIIELSALESSPGEIALYPVRFCDAVRMSAENLRDEIEQKRLAYTIELLDVKSIVLLDSDRFRKAFEKILYNAIKFTHAGGIHIIADAISFEHRGRMEGRVRVRVRDTGVGMSPHFVENAFEKFKQESTGLGRSYEGAGLGLTLARSYLHLMNGTIALASEPGIGTEVTLTLPIVGAVSPVPEMQTPG